MIHGHFVTVQRQCYGPTYQLTGVGSTDSIGAFPISRCSRDKLVVPK